jgi:hypothetical protein
MQTKRNKLGINRVDGGRPAVSIDENNGLGASNNINTKIESTGIPNLIAVADLIIPLPAVQT